MKATGGNLFAVSCFLIRRSQVARASHSFLSIWLRVESRAPVSLDSAASRAGKQFADCYLWRPKSCRNMFVVDGRHSQHGHEQGRPKLMRRSRETDQPDFNASFRRYRMRYGAQPADANRAADAVAARRDPDAKLAA